MLPDETGIVSGGSDSIINVWGDITEQKDLEKLQMEMELVEK